MSQRQATKEQQQIIEATEGNIRVRAVPGSGKTFTITHRIKYLTEECRVKDICTDETNRLSDIGAVCRAVVHRCHDIYQ